MRDDNHKYDDIIDMPHHVSSTHPHMSDMDRAAQFSPFAALTGYEEVVKETARVTDARKLREEDEEEALDWKLQLLEARLPQRPQIHAEYFVPDQRKSGGAFEQIEGRAWKISRSRQILFLFREMDILIWQKRRQNFMYPEWHR